ncbi:MAG: glycosyltransferase family 4 protein [Solirubrobacterales bacterium]|nr:glycosyltransferase family 4 protein [Solirubrobacterales bacterium]
MRVLVVMNFGPDDSAPQRGRWVVDQVEALRAGGIEVDLLSFPPGKKEYLPAVRRIRRRLKTTRYDLVHAHYGLAGWCALLAGARPLIVTFHGTDVRHRIVGPTSRLLTRRIDLVAGVSRALFFAEAGRPGLPMPEGRSAVLPCGGDLTRFQPTDRRVARKRLGLDPDRPILFFPANPARPEKRFDRASEVADRIGAELLSGGSIEPELMPDWINAANAVLVTSDYEGFGLACLEALACDVPVLSTPVGIAPHALRDLRDCHCAAFDPGIWGEKAAGLLARDDPRTPGRIRAEALSAERLARRVAIAYGDILDRDRPESSGFNHEPSAVSGRQFGNDGSSR